MICESDPGAPVPRKPAGAFDQRCGESTRDRRLSTCRAITRQARAIEKVIGGRLGANPELAMLLDLYVAEHEGRETYLWEVCLATAIPMSTAYGKLGRLVERGLLVRTAPSRDRRRIGLRFTPDAMAALDTVMDQLASL